MNINVTDFMSFDLEWFTTLPGMLITGGVVVLLIALIVFIASNKKGKKKAPEVAEVGAEVSVQPVADVNTPVVDMGNNLQNDINNSMPVGFGNPVPMTPASSPAMENVNGSVSELNNNSIPSINSGINNFASTPVDTPVVSNTNDTIPSINNNVAEPTVNTESSYTAANNLNNNFSGGYSASPANNTIDFSVPSSSVEPVIPNVSTVSQPAVNVNPVEPTNNVPSSPEVANAVPADVTPTETQAPEVKPVIYGGVDPANTFAKPQVEPKPVVYGGANPLENTQTIPTVNHMAYNTPSMNIASAPKEPEPVAPTSVVMPEVNSQFNEVPSQQPTPTNDADNSTETSSAASGSADDIETLAF